MMIIKLLNLLYLLSFLTISIFLLPQANAISEENMHRHSIKFNQRKKNHMINNTNITDEIDGQIDEEDNNEQEAESNNNKTINALNMKHSSSIPQHINCGCPNMNIQGQAVIVIVDSNSGSTWLGQLIDSHQCTLSFIPPEDATYKPHPDGHFRPRTYKHLLNWMKKVSVNARGRAYGVMLPWNYLDRLLNDIVKQPHVNDYNSLKAPRVLFYSREPIFQAISLAKKQELVKMKHSKNSHIDCQNVNQRGNDKCKMASNLEIEPTFKELSYNVNDITEHQKTAYLLSKRLAKLLNNDGSNNFLHLTYSELVCAQKQKGGNGFFPDKIAYFLNLKPNCPTHTKSISSVKSSPSNPASAMKNLLEILQASKHMVWHDALLRPYEAYPCDGEIDVKMKSHLTPKTTHYQSHVTPTTTTILYNGIHNKSNVRDSSTMVSSSTSTSTSTSSRFERMHEHFIEPKSRDQAMPRVVGNKNHGARQGRLPGKGTGTGARGGGGGGGGRGPVGNKNIQRPARGRGAGG